MADILALRTTMRTLTADLAAAQATLVTFRTELENAVGDAPPGNRLVQFLREQLFRQEEVVRNLTTSLNEATAAYQAAVLADPIHAADPGLPLVLLPVRLETAYLPDPAGTVTDLVIRVYPDDIHVDSHEPELTASELAAGTAYWQAVWGAGANQSRLDAAWSIILGQLKPNRAAWTVFTLTPSDTPPVDETPIGEPQPIPTLPDVPSRPGTFNRAARTTLLPGNWNFIGMRGDQELFNVAGSPIPDSLDVSFGPPDTGATDSDLPFGPSSRWLVDLDAAIANGMAVRIPLPGPDFSVDQLFVLGVSASVTPADAVTRLQSALTAHQFTNGLAFLPPGSPTNNTSQTRSSWQSAPQPPSPSDWNQARTAYDSTSNQNAAVAARALGIDGSQVLAVSDEGLLDQQFEITTLQKQFWPALGSNTLAQIYNTWVIPPATGAVLPGSWQLNVNVPQAQALQDHAGGWVRSRGTLPVLRIGNQPYGLLPALSLDDWVPAADDPTLQFFSQLSTLRDYWLAGVANVPRVLPNGDPNPDSTVVDVLSRLPVSVDIMVRPDGNAATTNLAGMFLPPAPIPGLPVNSQLFLSIPAGEARPLQVKVVSDPAGDLQNVMLPSLQMYNDGISVVEGGMTTAQFRAKYKDFLNTRAFPNAPPPDLFINLLQDSFTDPLLNGSVNDLNSIPALILCGGLFYDTTQTDATSAKVVALLNTNLPACKIFVAHYTVLCQLDPTNFESSLRETLDVFSHRLDAWITSLAARRLDEMRATEPAGLVIGAYGWIEDLTQIDRTVAVPTPPGFDQAFSNPSLQTFIHAPSLHHAATAAVLRSGYDSHADASVLAVNLVSSRVRLADWLAEGVRNGQTVGALLGYRFERGLHEAGLDALIGTFRTAFPLPLPTGADPDLNGGNARSAVAARNVVDGLALYNDPGRASAVAGGNPGVTPLLADLTNAMDAFGDLLLAESVHHLVGGNPLRAGLAADTVAGEAVPDRFDFALTPRSGQPLTWQVGALMAADFLASASGWQTSRPRATAEPHLDAWAATMLGNASVWQIACVLTSSDATTTQNVGLDTLGISALDAVIEISGSPSTLELRAMETLSAGLAAGTSISVLKTPNPDGSLGFAELSALCQRMQLAFGKASPLTPQNLQGSGTSAVLGLDVADFDSRAAALASSFSSAVQTMTTALQSLQSVDTTDSDATAAAVQALRAALMALADHGVPASWPAAPADTSPATISTLSAQAGSLSSSVQPLAALVQPVAPAAGADDFTVAAWLSNVVAYMRGILGEGYPLVPVFSLPSDSAYSAAFSPASAPAGADPSAIMLWLRRAARIRPNSLALHDVLLAAESLQTTPVQVTVAQLPPLPSPQWIGLPFIGSSPPGARLALVFSSPAPIDPSVPFCGFVCDTWTEQVPGLTTVAGGARGYEASEVSGLAFTTDGPNAAAPQCLLLAIAPDPSKGWSLDILFDTVKETLDMAKIRTVDPGDLPRLGRVLPAIHSGFNVDQLLAAAESPAGGGV